MNRRVKGLWALVVLGAAVPLSTAAQNPATPQLSFDVATIRRSNPADTNSNLNLSQGKLTAENFSVIGLLKFAYALNSGSDDQIVGAPGWAHTARFDVYAKEEQATALAIEKMSNEDREIGFCGQCCANPLGRALELERRIRRCKPRTVAALVQAKGGCEA